MKDLAKVVGLGAACAACCAVPFLIPLVAALGLGGISAALFQWEMVGLFLGGLGVLLIGVQFLRRRAATSCNIPPERA